MRYALIFCSLAFASLVADEGMWPFNQIPQETLAQKYGVQLTFEWLDHVQKASLRVSLGGSASLISSSGLFITNHHVGSKAIYNLSTDGNDLLSNGFYAKTLEEELPCPNCYVDQLISITDITEEVQSKIHKEDSATAQELAKNSAFTAIQERAHKETGLQPEIVSLYQGARYQLYLYRRFTDIRLVMAPEKSIAFFGGDAENFEYPRYDLDIAFFRIYEDGHPLHSPQFLPWSATGPQANELLIVSGNPGRTRRLLTAAHLSFLDQVELPLLLYAFEKRAAMLHSFSETSFENGRMALQDLFQIENGLKVIRSVSQGLSPRWGGWRESPILKEKRASEKALFRQVGSAPWVHLATALKGAKSYYPAYMVLEGSLSAYSRPYQWAKSLVRLAHELPLSSNARLREYSNTELAALALFLLSPEPVYPQLEEAKMADSLERLEKVLGSGHPALQIAMNGLSAHARAKELLKATQLFDLNVRRELYLHPELIESSQDPLLLFAKALDPYARTLRTRKEAELDHIATQSYTEIANLLFQLYGNTLYPDATFSPRLSFGTMRGYEEKGESIAPMTFVQGAFQLAQQHPNEESYQLPESWIARQTFLSLTTPFNFVSTHDIIGGNSGSPVINLQGEFVGLIFDGNRESILWDYHFSDLQGRAVSVHSQAILEVLQKVYQTHSLVAEIQGLDEP